MYDIESAMTHSQAVRGQLSRGGKKPATYLRTLPVLGAYWFIFITLRTVLCVETNTEERPL